MSLNFSFSLTVYDQVRYYERDQNMNFTDFLGQTVTIKIDRPLGSIHPTHGFIYPLNYGYVPCVMAPDGEELDAYLLGVFEPLSEFKGKCIAVIHRLDDEDDKLILVPQNKQYTDEQIRALTEFQEQFFTALGGIFSQSDTCVPCARKKPLICHSEERGISLFLGEIPRSSE